jgi:hypothetical protein
MRILIGEDDASRLDRLVTGFQLRHQQVVGVGSGRAAIDPREPGGFAGRIPNGTLPATNGCGPEWFGPALLEAAGMPLGDDGGADSAEEVGACVG